MSRRKDSGYFNTEPVKVGNVPIADYTINYEVHGAGPIRIALIMGFMASFGSWMQVVNHFAKNSKYSVLVLDNRGVGYSSNGSLARYTTYGLAEDFITVLKHIEWTQDKSVHLFGCSMGGMIAMEAALQLPE